MSQVRIVWVCAVVAVGIASGVSAQDGVDVGREPVIEVSGTEAPLYSVISTFFSHADAWGKSDHELYARFLGPFGIEAEWPSATELAGLWRSIDEAYGVALAQAESPEDFKKAHLEKVANTARAFGQLYRSLQKDGYTVSARNFLMIVEGKTRPNFAVYSDEPDYWEDVASKDRVFAAELIAEEATFAEALTEASEGAKQ